MLARCRATAPQDYSSYRDNASFLKTVDPLPGPCASWKLIETTVTGTRKDARGHIMKEVFDCWARDPVEIIADLLGYPEFQGEQKYAPYLQHLEELSGQLDGADEEERDRIFDEMASAEWWRRLQEEISKLYPNAIIAPVIVAFDKTQLSTLSGDKQAWPVYLTIGNIDKDVRHSERSLQGYRLFHFAMQQLLMPLQQAGKEGVWINCADGNVRRVFPSWLRTSRIIRSSVCVYRTPQEMLGAMANPSSENFDKFGVRDIPDPFWASLPYANIFSCIVPDLLHQLHKGVFKSRLVKWVSHGREDELDARFAQIPPYPNLRVFSKGISKITQWTGNEAREIEKEFVGLLDGLHQGGDYNTHSRLWDPDYPPHSAARTGEVLDLHARLGLRLLSPVGIPTHYPHRDTFRPTVIDLVWVPDDRAHRLYEVRVAPEERGLSDHAVIHAVIPAGEWSYQGAPSIAAKSEAERDSLEAIREGVQQRLPPAIPLGTEEELCSAVDSLYSCITDAWQAHARPVTICNQSLQWWDHSCSEAARRLEHAREQLEYVKQHSPRLAPAARAAARLALHQLKSALRKRCRTRMDEHIQEIAEEKHRVWDLMSWVGPRAMPTYRALVHNNAPIQSLPDLWTALDSTFHAAAARPVDLSIVNEIPPLAPRDCPVISRAEVLDALQHVSTSSTPGWDHLHWRHLKALITDHHFSAVVLRIYNAILDLGIWPAQFKRAVSVVIPKPYKDDYSRVKSHRPIVPLSTLGKLMEKVISERLHYECQRFGILHPNQFGGTKAHSTVDAATCLVTHVRMGWKRNLVTSCLAFDVAQFFPSMNHSLLCRILERYGFAPSLIRFFQHYLRGRQSCFRWGRATSPWFDTPPMGAGQGSALSPILTNI
ncbi:hypothetical protein VTO73DRAFT_13933 [Trametes versicolor]